MEIKLENQRVFISAGAAGMGRSTALQMLELGANVSVCDIDKQALRTLPQAIQRFECDVSDESQVDQLMAQVLADGLDILVNNAGVGGPTKPVEEVTGDEWQQCIAVCLNAPFYFTKRVVPVFKAQQAGVIINLVSAAGVLGFPNRAPYAAAKWGVTGLVKTLAMELGPHNVRVNGIVPGNVNGERMDRVVAAHAQAEGIDEQEVRRLYAIGTSMQCYVDPEEIAHAICFLCSDYGKHISGQILGIDGNTETLYPRQ
ncbi:MAG: SDR family oxidoreductase [Pseudomonadota bacterium]